MHKKAGKREILSPKIMFLQQRNYRRKNWNINFHMFIQYKYRSEVSA